MTGSRRGQATPRAVPEAEWENPAEGGTWVRDPVTGALRRPEDAAAAPGDEEAGGDDEDG